MNAHKIPESVVDALAAVRETGRTNMYHRSAVAKIAGNLGHNGAAVWLYEADSAVYAAAMDALLVRLLADRERGE
jgi:hypothetical protein